MTRACRKWEPFGADRWQAGELPDRRQRVTGYRTGQPACAVASCVFPRTESLLRSFAKRVSTGRDPVLDQQDIALDQIRSLLEEAVERGVEISTMTKLRVRASMCAHSTQGAGRCGAIRQRRVAMEDGRCRPVRTGGAPGV